MQSLLKKRGLLTSEREFSIPDQQGQVAMAHLKRLSALFRLKPTFPKLIEVNSLCQAIHLNVFFWLTHPPQTNSYVDADPVLIYLSILVYIHINILDKPPVE